MDDKGAVIQSPRGTKTYYRGDWKCTGATPAWEIPNVA
jgi:hypothetical protein